MPIKNIENIKENTRENNREENFEAIKPQSPGPMIITTNTGTKKTAFGRFGGFFFFLFLLAAGALGYIWQDYTKVLEQASQQPSENQEQVEVVENLTTTQKLARHIMLPSGEQPTVVTVEDAEGLKKIQPSLSLVLNGDLLVTYKDLQIVYREALDIIVQVRPTTSTAQSTSPQPEQIAGAETRAVQGVVKLDIRNGSGVSGAAAKSAETFKGVNDYSVVNVGNASKTTYTKTTLVNLTGKSIQGLEKQFGVTAVTSLPSGERASTADVVIIVGKN